MPQCNGHVAEPPTYDWRDLINALPHLSPELADNTQHEQILSVLTGLLGDSEALPDFSPDNSSEGRYSGSLSHDEIQENIKELLNANVLHCILVCSGRRLDYDHYHNAN